MFSGACPGCQRRRGPQDFCYTSSPAMDGEPGILVTTTENIPGQRRKQTLGEVFGVVVRSRGLGGNIMAGLRSIIGGGSKENTRLDGGTRRPVADTLRR